MSDRLSNQPAAFSGIRTRATYAALPLCLLGWCATGAAATAYKVDSAHSDLGFTATQTGAEFDGRFTEFRADIVFADADLAHSRFDVKIAMKSVNTGQDDRDGTLRGADLFNVDKFPTAHFVTTGFTRTAPGRYEATGKLTIRDVTHDVRLPFTFETKQATPEAWLKGSVTLKRLDYGVGQGELTDTSAIGNDVKVKFALHLSASATPAAPTPVSSTAGKKTIPTTPARGASK